MNLYKKAILTYNVVAPLLLTVVVLVASLGVWYYFSSQNATKKKGYEAYTKENKLLDVLRGTVNQYKESEECYKAFFANNASLNYARETSPTTIDKLYGGMLMRDQNSPRPDSMSSTKDKGSTVSAGEGGVDASFSGTFKAMQQEAMRIEHMLPQLHLTNLEIKPYQQRDSSVDARRDFLVFQVKYTNWIVKE